MSDEIKVSWPQRLELAKEIGTFSREDRMCSVEWLRCACGIEELDNRIPRYQAYEGPEGFKCAPIDKDLQCEGLKFAEAVYLDAVEKAENIYRRIKAREKVLLGMLL